MAGSETDVANSALRKLGAKNRIASLTDGTPNANVLLDLYGPIRQRLLRRHDWNFAKTRAKLAKLSDSPTYGYDNKFQLPSDWLRIIAVHDNEEGDGTVDYRLEGKKAVHSDAEDLWLTYVRDEDDVNEMSVDFREALAWRLAYEASQPIANLTIGKREQLKNDAEEALAVARSSDAMEDMPDDFPDGSWVDDRNR